jgi:RNA polymerase sigma factor (sigma-70 family)
MEVSTLPRGGGRGLSHPRQVLKAFGDDRLVELVRRGNEAAFEVVYERHHRGILSFCRHMLSSADEAEDAVQQVFVSAYYDLRDSDKPIRLKPWLYTIARNRCLSVLRARREQAAELDDIPTAGLSESVQQREDLRRMLADLHDLPVEQRAALVLSELGDLSHTDIAGVLDVPTPKVKSLVFQARSSLLESREARETSCQDIREQLATLRGGALRRGPLRKHLKVCAGCREFRDEVKRQRAAVAAILPVLPSAGLKSTIMGTIGGGGAAGGGALGLGASGSALATGGAALGSTAGVSSIVSAITGGGVTKVAAAVLATGAIAGGTVVVSDAGNGDRTGGEPMAEHSASDAPPSDAIAVIDTAPGARASATPAGTKEKGKKKDAKEEPVAGFFIETGPGGSGGSGGPGNGKGNGQGGSGDDGWFAGGPGRSASRGNGGANGNGGAKGNRGGNGKGPGFIPPRSPNSPNAGQGAPPSSPGRSGDRGSNGTRAGGPGNGNGRGPKIPLPNLLP